MKRHRPLERRTRQPPSPDLGEDAIEPTDHRPSRIEELYGWGHAIGGRCRVVRPEKRGHARAALVHPPTGTALPRGTGRSYGDAAINDHGSVVLTERLDRMLELDLAAGTVTCEAGVTLGGVVDHLLPRGLVPPVLPGTRHVTVGGAVAANVHGKNHPRQGAFSSCVRRFRLATPEGHVLTCSRRTHPEVFWATLGGMGLTGIVLDVTLELTRVESAYLVGQKVVTEDIEDTLDTLGRIAGHRWHAVAWLDATAGGLGRGVVTGASPASVDQVEDTGEPSAAQAPLSLPPRRTIQVPFRLPSWTLNRFTVRAFNALYHGLHQDEQTWLVPLDRFQFPLDNLAAWNRLYGRRGLLQHQSVLPGPGARQGIQALLREVAQAPVTPTLAVLKRMGPEDQGLLSFPMQGVSLALDAPASPAARELFARLNRRVAELGGRVYLAKDATLDASTFDRMYPQAESFVEIKKELDPQGTLSSSLARRVGLVPSTWGEDP